MKLSQIKTKEVRDRVRKSRYKKFIFAFIVLFLILIVSVCFHSYYAQQKAKKNATAKAQQKMENEYKKAKKEAEKEKMVAMVEKRNAICTEIRTARRIIHAARAGRACTTGNVLYTACARTCTDRRITNYHRTS